MSNYIYQGYAKKKHSKSLIKPFKIKKEVSIIIPTYNEEKNVERLVNALCDVLEKTKFKGDFEIVIVDDNSKDKTPEIIDLLSGKKPVLAIHRYGKKGIFSAIWDGIYASNGKFVITMDGDFSHPPAMLPVLLEHREDYDIVSGSRFAKGGGMEAPFHRKYGGLLLNRICAFIIGVKQKDVAGGFHVIRKDKFLDIEFKYPSTFGEFDFELFYRAKKKGFSVKEVPFTYKFRDEGQSKMTNLSSYAVNYFMQAFRLRLKG
jgi:dolichol-phosphate mannosyltransferase